MAVRTIRRAASVATTHGPDYALIAVIAVLCVIGLIVSYSASYALGYAQYNDANYFVKRQFTYLVLGALIAAVLMRIDYHVLFRLSPLLMFGTVLALAAVLLPGIGVNQNGAHRWINLGPLPALQPSEFAKLSVLVYMAAWLTAKGEIVEDMRLGVMPFVGMVGFIAALIMLEPDMGTTIMVAAITGTLFFVAGARMTHVLALASAGLFCGMILLLTSGYRAERLLSFTHAETDPEGLGFQTLQLLVAFGSGGFTGLGLGVSRQKFFYIPGSHTDGILAIVGEELGFIGVAVVLTLFAFMLWRGLRIARRAPDRFGSLLVVGVLAWISFQLVINVGGVTRSLPLTGIPLPFLSYGGSALMTLLAGVGIVLSVSRQAAIETTEQSAPTRGVLRNFQLGRSR